MISKDLKNGFYTEPHTTNTIAIIDNVAYCTSLINCNRIISNERVLFLSSIVSKWEFNSL